MANSTSKIYWNEKLQLAAPEQTTLIWNITAAVTVSDLLASPSLTTFSAIAAQSTIDNFLGTTNEFLIAAFDATAMGADAMGIIVNMKGQVKELYQFRAQCFSASNTLVTRQAQDSATLTASTLTTECALGAYGNVAFKIDWGNTPDFDGLTAGTIQLDFWWRSK